MKDNTAHGHNYTPNNRWESRNSSKIGTVGNEASSFKSRQNQSEVMAVTGANQSADSVTIALADVGCSVPPGVTCEATIVPRGLEVTRREDTYLIERDGDGYSLTGVIGRDELPERVPMWLEAVVEWFGVEEVQLGR